MRMSAAVLIVFAFSTMGAFAQGARPESSTIAKDVLNRLDVAWTGADSKAFAAEFTEDADVINIFGAHFQGRPDLTKRMEQIFTTIFKGSVHRSRTLERTYYLADDVLVAVSSAIVDVPSGPLAPVAANRQTFVLVKAAGRWSIRHWHNTPISGPNR